jgi:myo-inositol-1(or 4)-monophosphatase
MMMQYETLKSIAEEAGMILREGFSKHKLITFKSDIDLVTQYDLQIELFLKKKLSKAFPGYTLVGEETSENIIYPDKAIYIDPIDGTTNFVHGIPFCAISIGIWKDFEPVAGVVYNPILNELFYAGAGRGATMNDMPLRVSETDTLKKSLIATGFPYTKAAKGKDFSWVVQTMQSVLPETRDIRRLGSAAIDLCYVAKGRFDGYYEINLKPWDVSAGLLVLLEAGGKVSRHNGKGYALDDRILVASNGRIHDALTERMAEY